ncbi:Glycylpeptide N-tetradecanoyltransferase [Favolaschia claudopus]|uniref:Glycylpeptide N-tetradecanoyltransferase n=1 Tax=Favolaschia claudopus TaxID=2862362 RepID=A0AAW0A623_9AGAR
MSGSQNYKNASDIVDQGIVEGRPSGQQPQAAPVTIGTYVDKNAMTEEGEQTGEYELPGATSKDVHESMGQPGSGMSAKELRHGGQPGRKREKLGLEQYGTETKDVEA